MKKLLIALLVLVVLVIGLVVAAVVIGASQIDRIAKEVIERGGTYAMQVDTTVEGVDIQLMSGNATMTGLNVANPAGFDSDHFMKLGSSSASVDLNSVNTDKIVFPEIRLSGIDVILDKGGNPSNYNTILNSLKRFESGEKTAPDSAEPGKSVIIRSLVIEDVNVRLANMPGVSMAVGDVAVNIPQIELQNVGEKESMKPADVINLVVKTVLAAAVEAGGGIIPGDVLGDLTSGLGSLESLQDLGITAVGDIGKAIEEQLGGLSEQMDDLKKAGEDVKKQAEDAAKSVEDTANKVKDLFGGGKKDDEP